MRLWLVSYIKFIKSMSHDFETVQRFFESEYMAMLHGIMVLHVALTSVATQFSYLMQRRLHKKTGAH